MFENLFLIETAGKDVLEIVRDTLTSMLPHLQQMLHDAEPDPYTVVNLNQAYENLDIAHVNLWVAIIAAVAGCLGVWFGYLGYIFSKKTAANVVRVSPHVQRALCENFQIDLYQMLMYSLHYSLDGVKPTQKQLIALILSDFDDIFHIEAYNRNPEVHLQMKNIKERMLKYNEYVRYCYNNPEHAPSGLPEKSFYMLLRVHKLSEDISQERCWWRDMLERVCPARKSSRHETFNNLILKHVKNFKNNKNYFENNDEALNALSGTIDKYMNFLEKSSYMKPLLNGFFHVKDGRQWKSPNFDHGVVDDLDSRFGKYPELMKKMNGREKRLVLCLQ